MKLYTCEIVNKYTLLMYINNVLHIYNRQCSSNVQSPKGTRPWRPSHWLHWPFCPSLSSSREDWRLLSCVKVRLVFSSHSSSYHYYRDPETLPQKRVQIVISRNLPLPLNKKSPRHVVSYWHTFKDHALSWKTWASLGLTWFGFEDDICPNYKDWFYGFKINAHQGLAKFPS